MNSVQVLNLFFKRRLRGSCTLLLSFCAPLSRRHRGRLRQRRSLLRTLDILSSGRRRGGVPSQYERGGERCARRRKRMQRERSATTCEGAVGEEGVHLLSKGINRSRCNLTVTEPPGRRTRQRPRGHSGSFLTRARLEFPRLAYANGTCLSCNSTTTSVRLSSPLFTLSPWL